MPRVRRARAARHPVSMTSRSRNPAQQARTSRLVLSMRKVEGQRIGFSDLPGEIRNQIYDSALRPSAGGPISLSDHSASTRDLALDLLATCKTINKEATGILYNVVGLHIDIWPVTDQVNASAHGFAKVSIHYYSSEQRKQYAQRFHGQVLLGLTEKLSIMGANQVGHMRSILLVYRKSKPAVQFVGPVMFPKNDELVLDIGLLPNAPYLRFEVMVGDEKVRRELVVHRLPYLQDMICNRRIGSFTERGLIEICE